MLHPLNTDLAPPERMNSPFRYEPHPLCLMAVKLVCNYLDGQSQWSEELAAGKMLGVLVCRSAEGRLGFLAAYSGQLGGREDWPWFVPAVFDYLQPTGYFKQEEAAITAINKRITQQEADSDFFMLKSLLQRQQDEQQAAINGYRLLMDEAKARRDALRQAGHDSEALTRESQHQKAEMRRLKAQWRSAIASTHDRLRPFQETIAQLRQERSHRSDALQRWLFDQFVMLNARGERRTLTDIFAATPQRVPPSGAGECCAPKLLQYAFLHGLHPLCMAEFWQGRSPQQEVRHHGQFYPACRGKCKPILEWMMEGLDVETPATTAPPPLSVVYEDAAIAVVDKPSGLLSVPGNTGEETVESQLLQRYPQVFMVHRLDQDTSGLMIVALTADAYHHLQRQFLNRSVKKTYTALLDGEVHGSGTISLPLRPNPLDRPRQVVDRQHGRQAVTDYEVLGIETAADGRPLTRIVLTPHTGRTHQLRMHCAHAEGLAAPIVGDSLYGRPENPDIPESPAAPRLCLHATTIQFCHPVTGQPMRFCSAVPF